MTDCENCNAPMAPHQRYCLNCGARGGEARLPFLDILRADQETQVVPYGQPLPARAAAGVAPVPLGPITAQQRLQANAGLIAGVGVLLLAMLIGVLIGSGIGNDNTQAAAAPQVISLAGGAPVAATAATGATGVDPAATADTAAAATGSPKAKKKGSSSAATASKAPAKATNAAVQNLDKLTGKAAQKAADKLGKTIATGGKAPKKDSKPAAGGGSFDTIG